MHHPLPLGSSPPLYKGFYTKPSFSKPNIELIKHISFHLSLSLSLTHTHTHTLADLQPNLAEEECNKKIVTTLYEALATRDVDTVHRLLAPNIEWWFHGPPSHNHLMRLLTGSSSSNNSFVFEPLSIVAIGSIVVVEGYDKRGRGCSWVHAWTVADGINTQVREYCNTSVTVTRLGKSNSKVTHEASKSAKCQSVWQSKLADNASLPGLLLAL